jgi:hypothetical protein
LKNAIYHTGHVRKVCETKLEVGFRDGKEANGWYVYEGRKAARITVPLGKKFIPPKTYKSMAHQLKLTIPQFDSLLDCPLDKVGYDEILAGLNL